MAKKLNTISSNFFLNADVQQIAKHLLGKIIFTNIKGQLTSAIITETEAYQGPEDKASHAYNSRRTNRTEVMYQAGGCCYVYLCYGIHYLFNIVTNQKNIPHAILIRSGQVHSGVEYITERRGSNIKYSKLLNGPGNFSKGLGINKHLNGVALNTEYIWIEYNNNIEFTIKSAPRVGIDYAGEDALLPWRYILKY